MSLPFLPSLIAYPILDSLLPTLFPLVFVLLSSVAFPPSYPTFKKKSVLPSGLTLEILSFVVSVVHWSSVYHCIVKSSFVIFSNFFVDSLYLYTTLPLLLTTFSISKTLLFPI